MKKLTALLLLTALLVPAVASPAKADRGDHRGPRGREHFVDRDWAWRHGHWSHGRHGGRLGWWWVAGSAWNYYPVLPARVYGYPPPPVAVAIVAPPVYAVPVMPVPVAPVPQVGLFFSGR